MKKKKKKHKEDYNITWIENFTMKKTRKPKEGDEKKMNTIDIKD